MTLTEEESANLRTLWLKTFPEMNKHFQAERMVDPENNEWFKAITLTGRVRAKCGFCAALNTVFQGLAADCSKLAGWALLKAGYFIVCFIHDEYIIEMPFNEYTTARAKHISQTMINEMGRITTHVKVKAEPALMFSWSKAAEAYYDGEGDLLPWELVPKDEKGKPIDWDKLPEEKQKTILEEKHARFLQWRTH